MKTKNTISILIIAFLAVFLISIMGGTTSNTDNESDYMDTAVNLSEVSSDFDISFATYFGGSEDEQFKGIVTDSQDNIYFVGDTYSVDLPMVNSFDPTYNGGGWDGFLTKLSPDGSELLFSTYFGSSSGTQPSAITIDEQDNIWICGTCWGSGLPLVNPIDDTYGGGSDAFVAQFSPDGELMFSSYLGGSSDERPRGIAAEAGIVYVTGETFSQDFPMVNPLFPDSLGDGFWTKIDTVQNEISWSTRFDGLGDDVAIDSNGDVYLTGRTRGPLFPATISFAPPFDGRYHEDSFVLKTNANGNSIQYATRVGGNQPDISNCIYLLADGSVVVAGYTYSNDMPVVNPLKGTFGGERDGFLYILDPTGSSLEYLTYFGGSSLDIIANLEVDSTGNFVISGTTFSQDFPLVQPLFDTLEVGTSNAFVSILNPLTNELTFSTLFSGTTYGTGMTVDTDDSIIFGGNTEYYTSSLPVKNALYPYKNDKQDNFVSKLSSTPLDNTPPVTTIELSGTTGLNEWFISEVLVTLTATDDNSGVDYTEYSFDGINWLLYTGQFLIQTEGETTVYYRSFDNVGHEETIKTQLIKIDLIGQIVDYYKEFALFGESNVTNYLGFKIVIDSSGNIYVGGCTSVYQGGHVWSDLILIKYSNSGEVIWYRIWASPESPGTETPDLCTGLVLDSSENIYVVGDSGTHSMLLLKYDSDGNLLWSKSRYRYPAYGVAIDSEDNLYITGFYGVAGNPHDIYAAKYDNDGVLLWETIWGRADRDREMGYDIVVDSIGNVYIAGHTDFMPILMKFSNSGDLLWYDIYTDVSYGRGYGIALDSLDNIYVVGLSDGSNYFRDIDIRKFESSGNQLWKRTFGGPTWGDDWGFDIFIDASDYIYIGGTCRNQTAENPPDVWDYCAIKYDSLGNLLWSDIWGRGEVEHGRGIATDKFNNIFLVGVTQSIGTYHYDLILIKYLPIYNYPSTSINLIGDLGNKNWYKSEVSVSFDAIDDISGINKTEYSFDGLTWFTYSVPFVVAEEGETTIFYRSIDNAGNIGTPLKEIIKIDYSQPITSINIEGLLVFEDWYDSNALISLLTHDTYSGISTTQYSFDGVTWLSYGEPFNMEGLSLHYYSTDIAGNIEATKSITIKTIEFPIIIDEIDSNNPSWEDIVNMGICTGSGTLSDPFIIENFIFPEYDGYVIEVRNSEVFFIIRNCESFGFDYGIRLENVSNGLITENFIHRINTEICNNINVTNNLLETGQFYIFYTNNSVFSGNTFNQAESESILLSECYYNEFSNNLLYGMGYGEAIRAEGPNYYNIFFNNTIANFGIGLFMEGDCDYNVISQNYIHAQVHSGIFLDACDYNLIIDNLIEEIQCYNDPEWGEWAPYAALTLFDSNFNTVLNNNIRDCDGNGMNLIIGNHLYCEGNNITNNVINNNNGEGIYIKNGYNNTIQSNNILNNAKRGIYITGHDEITSEFHNIWNNVIENNFGTAIRIEFSQNFYVSENLLIDNEGLGVTLYYCSKIDVSGNIITDNNEAGIAVEHSNDNSISNNEINQDSPNVGISLYHSNYNLVSNNIINGCEIGSSGIHLRSSSFNTVFDNFVLKFQNSGIHLRIESDNNLIEANTLSYSYFGIFLDVCFNNTLSGNLVENNIQGICLGGSYLNTISFNIIENNDIGILIEEAGNNNSLIGNIVSGNLNNGISIEAECDNNIISGNIINDNSGDGITINMCSYNLIIKNFIFDNGMIGLRVQGYGTSNQVYENFFAGNLEGNAFDEAEGTNWDNGTIGNYWDDYTGVDDNDDGIGDTPYYVPGESGSIDRYPIFDDGTGIKNPIEYLEIVISILEELEVPCQARCFINIAINKLYKAIDWFEEGEFYKAFNQIKIAVKKLTDAQEFGAETQEIIDALIELVQFMADKAINEATEMVGADNKFVIRAQEHYSTALVKLSNGKYHKAVKFFKRAYKNAMKARCQWIDEGYIDDLVDHLDDIRDLILSTTDPDALNALYNAETKMLIAIEKANNTLLEASFYRLEKVINFLFEAEDYGVETLPIICLIMESIDDVVYLKIVDAENTLFGIPNDDIEKAWIKYYKAKELWEEMLYHKAIDKYVRAIELVIEALL